MNTIVILGTAHDQSQTHRAITELCPFSSYELIDLRQLKIDPYDYSGPSSIDDFLMVAKKMETADNIVFATPVYWYAMSGCMKIFFDRLSDLLSTYKAIGKALEGKRTFLIATGTEPQLPEGFEVPFRRTSDYFNMTFEKSFYKVTQ